MAHRGFKTGLVLVLVTMMLVHSLAQLPNCAPAIVSLSPCLGFITGNSSAPSSSCCTQLASVVQSQAQCLCTVLNGAPQLGFVVNQTQALTLPGACKIQTPPISQCNAASGPPAPAAGSPQGTPAPASPVTPSDASAPSATSPTSSPSTPVPSVPSARSGSKTVPTTNVSSSARSSIKFTPSLLFFLVLVASALSSF